MWFWRTGTDLGIDLGTATVLVYVKGKGVILKEPSVVAINKNNNKLLAVGEEARRMIGRTPGNIVAVRPLRDGVISNYDVTERMLKEFIRKACGKRNITAPKVMVCVPSQATEVEKRAVIDAARNSGAKTVHLIEEPLAAAIGAGIDITKPNGNMVIDIGGGTCDIAVISLGGIVERSSIKIAGDKFTEAIIKYVRNKYKIMIGEKTAEDLKIGIGSAFKGSRSLTAKMKGRNLVTGLPDELEISTEEIREALEESVESIVDVVKTVLERTPPELAADIIEKGILMTGGGALLYGLDKLIEFRTGVEVTIAENAIECVAEGTGAVLGQLDKLDNELNSQEIVLIE
ncbi:rod shape-determining protein [Clostridium botulinum]|uniref:Cell shape-determining protein MreB n=1 Tax=Clostridium botulinum (strain Eklund 17B / Type B) TaxID=935198 RepID=B2TK07_CLOBB|nr:MULTISPECIES: rod shape-determining protein [Clostridium]ACD22884.1 Mbl protein [Clostridium botulinum B str. Eklund 17B (NRP)]AIY79804.1 cell shape determining, MreB/Mrl family protein [Clostridium botulinum 202F]KAI3344724.1 rod shape-determining protein [Clostridium botulinum]KFX54346.1 rod shape-determining protein MreB [Clostridium botulinum]KFX58515.1 rod shape-determining protein MreB [Clostridium botulinum]